MTGLVEEQMAPEAAPTELAPGANQGGDSAVAPEEQEAYERVIMAASKFLYDPKASQPVLEILQSGAENPAQAIASATKMVVQGLDDQSGGQIPEVVILPAAGEIGEMVGELAHAKGFFQVDQNVLGQAGQIIVVEVADEYGVSEEDLQSVMQGQSPEQLAQIQQEQGAYAGA